MSEISEGAKCAGGSLGAAQASWWKSLGPDDLPRLAARRATAGTQKWKWPHSPRWALRLSHFLPKRLRPVRRFAPGQINNLQRGKFSNKNLTNARRERGSRNTTDRDLHQSDTGCITQSSPDGVRMAYGMFGERTFSDL